MGADWALVGLSGAWLPFAAVQPAEGDPRPAIAARYASMDDYQTRCAQAARALVAQGYLLERDVERVEQRAHRMYEWAIRR